MSSKNNENNKQCNNCHYYESIHYYKGACWHFVKLVKRDDCCEKWEPDIYIDLIERLNNPKIVAESDWRYLCQEAASVIEMLSKRCSAYSMEKSNCIQDAACAIPFDLWNETIEEAETIWGNCMLGIKKLSEFYEKDKENLAE